MVTVGLVLAGLAALLHVYIFWLESVVWTSPRAQRVFGPPPQEAAAPRGLAYNQGFYNLFLAVVAVVGIVLVAVGHLAVGAALVLAGTGSMLAAALVLVLSDRSRARAAFSQGTLPALTVLALVLGLLA